MSEIWKHPKFLELIDLLRYFWKPISLFLDENTLTSSLHSDSDFAKSSITCDLGSNSLKRGIEKLYFSTDAAKSIQKCQN